ncbi:hypothetical protein PFICI_04701 [Pestalotiopsis fici W106-1]|uniref:Uncharacterized protein n=1 Tax=Pestalotiopsis fici (strain W106-1 / CGMCC3.15140) TaxID=1229662 RepID=W3X9U3_PESFW|nr:uncharacterized protein PFICI_04701 [Pestalotiopsis fici W106-1]ETS82825.1 hypothetical protein PFICI_04701 [Pestalotiopsis fici W106-1]
MLFDDTQSHSWSDREIDERSGMITRFSMHLWNIANHAFFILDNGYMGTALFSLQVDDVVFLLAGSPWPIILRRDDNGGYTFVAAAYVHGVMYGEAWPQSSDQLQDIVLV